MRVVSLVPSSTETLLALGADVVACTRFCEQPDLPHVGGTKNPDVAAIIALRPDLVVLDEEENRRQDADALAAAGLRLVVSAVRSVDDAVRFVERLATVTGRPAPGAALPTVPLVRARALVPIWRRPWMTISVGTYGGDLLAHLGVEVVGGTGGATYPTVTLDEVVAADPDVLLVPSEPYEFDDAHVAELHAAVPDAAVIRLDGRDVFWWGIRTPAALRRLGAALTAGGLPPRD